MWFAIFAKIEDIKPVGTNTSLSLLSLAINIMFKSVKIENFRSFQSFELQQLGRINLLVGENNSGKTSILEAIQLLCSRNNLDPLREMISNRSEYFFDDVIKNIEFDIRHLFNGHEIKPGSQFSITGISDIQEKLIISIETRKIKGKESQSYYHEVPDAFRPIDFNIHWIPENKEESWTLPLSTHGGIVSGDFPASYHRDKNSSARIQFITSSSLSTDEMVELFDQIVLTPEEELVNNALNKIDSKIKRIAPISSSKFIDTSKSKKGRFLALLSDSNQRVPIGSMGDGIWHMLGIVLATVCAEGGYLLIDDIDTGLHFTTMSDMWKMIWETAKRLNVQVFATTHNDDCWRSLADIAEQEDVAEDGIRIHRIERGKEKSVVFIEPEIIIAAEEDIEVR